MKTTVLAAYLIGALVMAYSGFGAAQAAEKVYRIGYLSASAINNTFREALQSLGYIEGKNLVFEYRQAKTTEQYQGLAEDLVRLKVDLILTVGVSATRESKKATTAIPIVMGNSSADPVLSGLIQSLARPGGNVTGVFDLLPNLAGKRIELLKETFPNLSRIAHIAPDPPGKNSVGPAHFKKTVPAARAFGIAVENVKIKRPEDIEGAFEAVAKSGVEAAVLVGVSFFIPYRKRIVEAATNYRLPIIYTHSSWVSSGGLMAYTTSPVRRWRRAAELIDQIFRGRSPAEIPAEQPTTYVLAVNLKAAKSLGITVPPTILSRANVVIE